MVRHKKHPKRQLLRLLAGVFAVGYAAFALVRPLPTIIPTFTPVANPQLTATAVSWPGYGGASIGAVGYGVLASAGVTTALPTASIAKVMTALCVLRQKPLNSGEQGPSITITQADVDSYNKYISMDGSVVPVSVGEQFSEYQLLQAMLLPSANNIAETLANWAFGSIDAYNAYANQYAASLKLASVHVTDPSGFLPDTVASAADLTLLGEIAMQNPVISAIVAQPSAVIADVGTIRNVNRLVGTNGTIGIKTGNNDQDPGAYLFAANQQVSGKQITIIGTIMNAQDLGTALYSSLPLIASATANFTVVTPVKVNQVVGHYDVPWQGDIPVIARKPTTMIAWNSDKLVAKTEVKALNPRHANASIGTVILTNQRDSRSTATELALQQPFRQPGLIWRLSHPLN